MFWPKKLFYLINFFFNKKNFLTQKIRAKTQIYFLKIIQICEKKIIKILWVLVWFPEISMKVCKYFESKHFWLKSFLAQTFSNRAYSAACASSELLRACFFGPLPLQPYNLTTLQPYNITTIQHYNHTTLQPHNLTKTKRQKDKKIQRYKDTKTQRHKDTKIQRHKDKKIKR